MEWINQDLIVVLVGYLRGLITIDQMRGWLAESVWELADSRSPLNRMILGEVELGLAEFDRGDRDEAYLREHIFSLLHMPNPDLSPGLRESLTRVLVSLR